MIDHFRDVAAALGRRVDDWTGNWIGESYVRRLTVLLAVVVVVAVLVGTITVIQVTDLLQSDVEQSMTSQATTEADQLAEWVQRNRLSARLLSEHPAFVTGDRNVIRGYLRGEVQSTRRDGVVNVFIVNRREDAVTVSTSPEKYGTNLSDIKWRSGFAFDDFDDVSVSRPYRNDAGLSVVSFASPVPSNPELLLVMTVRSGPLTNGFNHPVDGGFTRVVDANGTVVFADDGAETQTQYLPGETERAPAVEQGLLGKRGFTADPAYETVNDGEYVAAYAPVEGTDWVVVEHAPRAQAFAITREVILWLAISTGITIIGIGMVALTFGARTAGAIKELVEEAERVGAGDLDEPVDRNRRDELGQLQTAFDEMRRSLRNRARKERRARADLQQANQRLERRTTMVTVLNRVLRHDVRNDMNVIAGHTARLARESDDPAETEDLRVVRRTALELAELADRTRRVRTMLSGDGTECIELQIGSALTSELEQQGIAENVRVRHAETDDSLQSEERGCEQQTDLLVSTVPILPATVADLTREIVSNGDGETVEVTISSTEVASDDGEAAFGTHVVTATLDTHEDPVTVEIETTGDGLPLPDVEAVTEGRETAVVHGTGLSLWVLSWVVEVSGGSLSVSPDGQRVVVRLPMADSEDSWNKTTATPSSQ
jgi:signal transduction histidine kinase